MKRISKVIFNDKKRFVTSMYIFAFLMTGIYMLFRVHEYTVFNKIDISNYEDYTERGVCDVEELVDSDYVIIKGYCYIPEYKYKSIKYSVVLIEQTSNSAYVIPTQVVERPDLLEDNPTLNFNKVGFYARASKKKGQFGSNYYEIGYLMDLADEKIIVHSGKYMGTE